MIKSEKSKFIFFPLCKGFWLPSLSLSGLQISVQMSYSPFVLLSVLSLFHGHRRLRKDTFLGGTEDIELIPMYPNSVTHSFGQALVTKLSLRITPSSSPVGWKTRGGKLTKLRLLPYSKQRIFVG